MAPNDDYNEIDIDDIDYEINEVTEIDPYGIVLYQDIVIKSHFNIPEVNTFYLNDSPQIRYMPFGAIGNNETLNLHIVDIGLLIWQQ